MRLLSIIASGIGGILLTGFFAIFALRTRNPIWFSIAFGVGLLVAAGVAWRTGRTLPVARQIRDFGIAVFLAANFGVLILGLINPHAGVLDLYSAFFLDLSETTVERSAQLRRWFVERPLRRASQQQGQAERSGISVEGANSVAPGWKKLELPGTGSIFLDEKSARLWSPPLGENFPDWSVESAQRAQALCQGLAPAGSFRLPTTQEFMTAKENGAFAADPQFRNAWVTLLLDEKRHLLAGGAALFGAPGGQGPRPHAIRFRARCIAIANFALAPIPTQ